MTPAQPILLRSRSHQVLCFIGTGACLLFIAAFLFVASRVTNADQQYVATIVFLGLTAVTLRYAYASVVFDHTAREMLVRNPFMTHRIALDDVDRFDLRKSWVPTTYGNNRRFVIVRPKDGPRVTLIGVCALGDTKVRTMLAEVRAACDGVSL